MAHQVFDMRRLHQLEAPPLLEREIAAGKLDLQIERMKTRSEKDGDFGKGNPLLTQLQDLLGDESRLLRLFLGPHQGRLHPPLLPGKEALRVLLLRLGDHGIGQIEDRLRRSVVLFELVNLRSWEILRKTQNVLEIGPAEGVDALGVIPHRHHPPVPAEQADDLPLDLVGILIFIDQEMLILLGQRFPDRRMLRKKRIKIDEKIVIIDQVAVGLVFLVTYKEGPDQLDLIGKVPVFFLDDLIEGQ
ncbi:MAG: hypothetical protein MPW15_14145 [Candidatus Manganitrophus sp.]|nr:hypothetical protein [Candidatus Manganitrophus sp.]